MTIRELIEELELKLQEYGDISVYSSLVTDDEFTDIKLSIQQSYTQPTVLVL